MNKKSLTIVAAIALALLTITCSTLTAMKVFAAQSSQTANQKQAQAAPNGPTPAPIKWEYRILSSFDSSILEQQANRLSEQGFEVFEFEIIQPVSFNSAGAATFVMVLKRAKP